MAEPICFRGPGGMSPDELENTLAAARALRRALPALTAQFGPVAAQNALMLVWLEMEGVLRAPNAEPEGLA